MTDSPPECFQPPPRLKLPGKANSVSCTCFPRDFPSSLRIVVSLPGFLHVNKLKNAVLAKRRPNAAFYIRSPEQIDDVRPETRVEQDPSATTQKCPPSLGSPSRIQTRERKKNLLSEIQPHNQASKHKRIRGRFHARWSSSAGWRSVILQSARPPHVNEQQSSDSAPFKRRAGEERVPHSTWTDTSPTNLTGGKSCRL